MMKKVYSLGLSLFLGPLLFANVFTTGVDDSEYAITPIPFVSSELLFVEPVKTVDGDGPYNFNDNNTVVRLPAVISGPYMIRKPAVTINSKSIIMPSSTVMIKSDKLDIIGYLDIKEGASFDTQAF